MDEFLNIVSQQLGPMKFEANRRAIVATTACAMLRGVPWGFAIRYGEILGRHWLSQKRIDRLCRIPAR